jgi:SAM-dependent methyltransferase
VSRAEEIRIAAGRRFARLVTVAVTRFPSLWPVFRRLTRLQFHTLAPRWDTIIGPEHFAPLHAALEALDSSPSRALDVGTGTGEAVFEIARRFPQAEVVGVDLAEGMVEEARRKAPPDLAGRVRFEVADASHLPFDSDRFDLVTLANMIPFFDELARVTAPGGAVVFSFASGADTPIYVPLDRIRDELRARGFSEFADFQAGSGTALLARRPAAA